MSDINDELRGAAREARESSAYCIVLRTLTAWPDAVIPYPSNAWVRPTVTPEQTTEGLRIRVTWYALVKCDEA